MMGRQNVDQSQLFYLFNLEGRIPRHHLLRRINPVVTQIMAELREKLGHLANRWFCRLDLDDKVPDHSTFSVNRHGRFRESDAFRHVFEAVVRTCSCA